jgi:hypothetical protein
MKTIQVSPEMSAVKELLELAGEENILLRTPEGREFVLAEVDDFDREIELVRQNKELMEFLASRSQEKKRFSLQEVREKLNLP